MKIVLVNKYFYPKGGDCLYTLRLMSLLQNNGHTVIPFGMSHPRNIQTEYDKYFVSYIDFNDELKKKKIANSYKVASRAIVNLEAARSISRLIDDTKPDLIHLQNIHHQLTPSIIIAAAQKRIPVVWTLHDYILTCPNDNFFHDGNICTRCASGNNIHAVINKCKKDSLGASILAALECTFYHRMRLGNYVDKFICPSQFMADILIENGTPSKKITVIPNFLPISDIPSTGEDYFFYAGRMTIEKGLEVLLNAYSKIDNARLLLAGDGPNIESFKELARDLRLQNAEFLGKKSSFEIQRLLAGCRASIVPSICYDNLPYAVMETMMAGKVTIASHIGGIPEMIEHEKNGLKFEPRNSSRLAQLMNRVWFDDDLVRKLGNSAREKAISSYSPEQHYQRLIQAYNEAVGRRGNSRWEPPENNDRSQSEQYVYSMKG